MVLQEAIFKGATRPAMKFGIPLVPLVILFGTAMLVILWGGLLFSWWIAASAVAAIVPALAWMRFVTKQDDQRFRQIFLAAKLRMRDRNRRFWQARAVRSTIACAPRRRRQGCSACRLSCSRASCSGAATGSACCASGSRRKG